MTVFLVILSVLISLNVLLLLFSSNRRFRVGKSSAVSGRQPAVSEDYPLRAFDSEYQKAV